ncbi:hypothetical protein [Lacrimispora sp.]|uniref:hypothetical protein n=1 Tax=Lacrimispora sp. TaxID=2719234 RepID=UPI0039E493C7
MFYLETGSKYFKKIRKDMLIFETSLRKSGNFVSNQNTHREQSPDAGTFLLYRKGGTTAPPERARRVDYALRPFTMRTA